MQHDHQHPPRTNTPNAPDKLGPSKGIMHGLGLAAGFGTIGLAFAIVASLGVWGIVAIWGAIL